jgi:hypothetical protein
MKKLIGAALMATAMATGAGAVHAQQNVVGVWRLIAYTAVDPDSGAVIEPFGSAPQGVLHYTAGGRMSAVLSAGDRKRFSAGNRINAPVAERAEAFSTSTAYAGTYTLEGDRVTHHVEIATNPDWVGGDQLRYPKVEGNRLTITTPPLPTRPDGKLRVSTLVWERAE